MKPVTFTVNCNVIQCHVTAVSKKKHDQSSTTEIR